MFTKEDFIQTKDAQLEIAQHLIKTEEYKDLGWLNSGIKLPQGVKFDHLGSNASGSHCIYVNDQFRLCYHVDMGD